jgi:uncharacterized membrane protein YesL
MFFKDYHNPGKGIEKNTPPKKGIPLFVELLTIDFWGFVGLNMLYFVLCIPVVTIGGATLAYNKLCCDIISNKHVFVFSDFFEEFKRSFKKGILLSVVIVFVIFDLFIIYTNLTAYAVNGMEKQWMAVWIGSILISIILTSSLIYLTLIMANLDMSFLFQLKNAALLMILGGWKTLVSALFNIAVFVFAVDFFPFSGIVFLIGGFYILFFVNCFTVWPVILKYAVLKDEK